MAFAGHEFRLALAHDDGSTERDHLESARRQLAMLPGRKKRAAAVPIEGPECPAEVRYLWRWFCEISFGIAVNGFAASVVTWTDLVAWSALTGTELRPWEARSLVELGRLRADVCAQESRKRAR